MSTTGISQNLILAQNIMRSISHCAKVECELHVAEKEEAYSVSKEANKEKVNIIVAEIFSWIN